MITIITILALVFLCNPDWLRISYVVTRLTSRLQQSSCLCFPRSGVTSLCHCAWPVYCPLSQALRHLLSANGAGPIKWFILAVSLWLNFVTQCPGVSTQKEEAFPAGSGVVGFVFSYRMTKVL